MGQIEIAKALYPFDPRFRDGRKMRLKMFYETGE